PSRATTSTTSSRSTASGASPTGTSGSGRAPSPRAPSPGSPSGSADPPLTPADPHRHRGLPAPRNDHDRPRKKPMTLTDPSPVPDYDLDAKYERTGSSVFMSGTQAMVRLVLEQLRHDERAGLRTRAFVSGYPGSPLGGLDLELARNKARAE